MELRDYQKEAYEIINKFLDSEEKSMCLQLPTGAGKSILIKNLINQVKDKRILIITHSSKLLEQNAKGIESFGFYCSELGKKCDSSFRVVFASVQSLGRKPEGLGRFDVVLVDECHLVDNYHKQQKLLSMYTKIIRALEPPKLIGLTATPYRSEGNIYGNGSQFQKLGYELQTDELIKKGYLSPYKFPEANQTIDTSKMRTLAGDFHQQDLQQVCEEDKTIDACLEEWAKYSLDRNLTLFFCVGKEHALKVSERLNRYLKPEEIAYISGDTEDKNSIIEDIKTNNIKAICSIGVLTTGVDIPRLDCICLLRPTKSTSLFIQMVGRGLRLHPGKKDCLIIDLGGNLERFGSINAPFVATKTSKERKQKDTQREVIYEQKDDGSIIEVVNGDFIKTCKKCGTHNWPAVKRCQHCNYMFLTEHELFIHKQQEEQVLKGIQEKEEMKQIAAKQVFSFSCQEKYISQKGNICSIINIIFCNGQNKSIFFVVGGSYGGKNKERYDNIKTMFSNNEILFFEGAVSGQNFDSFKKFNITLKNGELISA